MIAPAQFERPVVLHVRVVTGAGGGPDKTILRSPRYMRNRGYDELCAFLRPPGDDGFAVLERRAADADAELIAIDDRGPLDWRIVGRIIDVCRQRSVGVWHGHDYKSNLLGLLVARVVPLRLVTTVHGWVEQTWRTGLYHFADRCSLRFYERVICVSPDLHAACVRAGVHRTRCTMLDNAIETDVYRRHTSVREAKQLLGYSPDEWLIGAVGRLSPEKGFDYLIAAFEQLAARWAGARLAIVGEGPDRPRLERRIAAGGLENRVRLIGHRDDVPRWLEALDVFALSSLREGLPNVLLEAMALETPVAATRIAGVPRLVEDGVSGCLVPPGDAAALAGAIEHLLADESARARLARQGRETVCNRFSFSRRMEAMQSIYDELLNPR
jgi:glycosyltransferase involved in cell wall biosynthesis